MFSYRIIYLSMYLPIVFLIHLAVFSFQCDQGFFNYDDVCFSTCPSDTYPQITSKGFECLQCDITKNFILDPSRFQCVCALQTFMSPAQDQCYPCHYTCLSCRGPNYNDCLTCDTEVRSTFRVRSREACVCSVGFYDDSSLQSTTCQRCHIDCSSCSGPEDTDCIECAAGKTKNQFGQCICDNDFLVNEDGNCYCPYRISPDGTCKNPVNQCPPNEQTVKLTNIAKAGKKGSPFNCECKSGFNRIKGACLSCGVNQVYNPNKRRCQCVRGSEKYQDQCIICNSLQIFKKKEGRCICKKNLQETQTGDCIRCPPKMIYKDGQCACVFNFYLDPRNNKCRKCTKKTEFPSCIQDAHNIDMSFPLSVEQIRKKPNNGVKTYFKNIENII